MSQVRLSSRYCQLTAELTAVDSTRRSMTVLSI